MTPRERAAIAPLVEVPTLDQVADDPTLVARLPRDAALVLYARAAIAEAALRVRVAAEPAPAVPSPAPEAKEEWLSAGEVEARFSLPKRWLSDHMAELRQLRIVSRPSRKRVVFHRARLARFMESRCEP
jgi:hypothetical protein